MPITIDNLKRARDAGLDDDRIVASIERNDPDLAERFKKGRSQGLDNKRILSAYERRLTSETPISRSKDDAGLERPQNASNGHLNESGRHDAPQQFGYTNVVDNAQANEGREPVVPSQLQHPNTTNTSSNSSPINTSTMLPDQPQPKGQTKKPEPAGLADFYKQGLRNSASGEFANIGKPNPQLAEDPNFWQALVQEAGSLTGDGVFMAAGGTLGASAGAAIGAAVGGPFGIAAGGLLGGGAGALALPEFLKSSLQEYRDYTEKGNDLTFGEFLERADRVGSKTLNAGIMGAILGTLNKAAPLLKNMPGIGKLFTSKIAQKTSAIGLETTALATIPKVSAGELPDANDFAHALGLVLGFNALKLPGAMREKIQKRGESSGLKPLEFAKTPEAKEIANEIPKKNSQTSNTSSPVQDKQYKTEANKKAKASKENVKKPIKPTKPKDGDPIIETTGKSAKDMLQPEPSLSAKVKETTSKVIEKASDLKQLANDINTGVWDALIPLRNAEKNIPIEEQVTTRVKQAQSVASEINNVLNQGIFDNAQGKYISGSLKDAYLDQQNL